MFISTLDSSDSSLPSPFPKSLRTPATLRRCSQSRRPRRQSPLLAARRCCAALLLRPTPLSPPTRLHRRRLVSIAIALDCLWRSSYSRGRRRLVSGLKGRKSFFLKSSSKVQSIVDEIKQVITASSSRKREWAERERKMKILMKRRVNCLKRKMSKKFLTKLFYCF
ncbi:uncharacterized protein LOC115997042 [Ipomoea triloba]|uniref:uncharacterized protein LOC115997042 n=1 Tax=Ipomoea triloba TaxID=35885 RepID=UPI00125DD37C|nr:uncharacterized protein LOC115997042 [Ipomoea triloba]